jgi:hypothetical protein
VQGKRRKEYPAQAYSASGELWWKLTSWPRRNQRFGTEPKLASWLNFNAKVGDVFTIRQLRKALGDAAGPSTHEHFNRRLRSLRRYRWIVFSSRDAGDLKPDQYRLQEIGAPIWLGKSKYSGKGISDKTRRDVFDRDGHRCVLCGVGAGEPYPDQPTKLARLTIGHFVADSLRGPNDPANLRTECSRCNEPLKEEARRSESADEISPKVRSLSRRDKMRLFTWMENGYRERDAVDRLFDQIRILPASQRDAIAAMLKRSLTT